MTRPRFHLVFPVHDLEAARSFCGGVLGCAEGSSSDTWVDFDLHGHQVVTYLAPVKCHPASTNSVDGHEVPASHFGLLLNPAERQQLVEPLQRADDTQIFAK